MDRKPKICLLGASFDTGNMGVSALAEASIKCILNRWPDAEVTSLGTGAVEGEHRLKLLGRDVRVMILRLRFCKNVFLPSHFCVLLLNALLIKLLPWRWFRNLLSAINPCVKTLIEADRVFDITAGDSFSDIYGFRRFVLFGFMQKWLVMKFGKELILLPQTYGPFKRPITRQMATYVLKHASAVYARDSSSVQYVHDLLGSANTEGKVRFVPDVAFVLDSKKPENIDVGQLETARTRHSIVVGLNISGLLFNGGYTQKNMFGLETDYSELVYSVIDFLMKDKRRLVLLVPHVFAPNRDVESDPDACQEVYEKLREEYPGRIFLTRGKYNHNDIKYVIGLCDFFIGSRMHACIAAISQCIPTVGLAYSKKFEGVFQTVGMEQFVVDMHRTAQKEALAKVKRAFKNRVYTRDHVRKMIPMVQKTVLSMLDDID